MKSGFHDQDITRDGESGDIDTLSVTLPSLAEV